jgi:hypothetical protein
MEINTIIRTTVGADLSRPQPIYRPSVDFLVSGLFFKASSNELDRSSSLEMSSLVILSAAKDLVADRDRPFAELTLS